MLYANTPETITPVHPTLTVHTTAWAQQLAADVAAARQTINVAVLSLLTPTPRMVGPWPHLWRQLLTAPGRGVRLRLAMPRPTRVHPATHWNAKSAEPLQAAGAQILWCDAPRLVHAKCWAIDSHILWIGSGNCTAAACHHNRECWVRAWSPGQATFLHHWIEALPIGS